MTTDVGSKRRPEPGTSSFFRTFPQFLRDPLKALEWAGKESGGAVTNINLGVFRPYLVTHPEHVRHVLRDNATNYLREGMMWKPFSRLVGHGIAGEGPGWARSREIVQSVFSGRYIASITDEMGQTIADAVDRLGERAGEGETVDAGVEMTRIVQSVINRAFFGSRISSGDADRLGEAIRVCTVSFGTRMLMPFVSHQMPMPGDRSFRRAVRTVDEIMYPIVEDARRSAGDERDITSLLVRARDESGEGLDDRQVRDDLVALFVAGSESTAVALTWLWVALETHPQVAARLYEEVDRVVGTQRPQRAHLPHLAYTKMVLQEVLRVYSVGWIIPRTAARDDVIDGVPIKAGSTVLISPYLTHRVADVWENPEVFDPERFTPEQEKSRSRFAYLTFGAGPHQCLGSNFSMVEAQLVVAAMLTRFRPRVRHGVPAEPQVRLTLRPRRPVEIELHPRH